MTMYSEYLKKYNQNFKENNSSKSVHQEFWEVALSGYLLECGFNLKRGNPEKGFLDFYFENTEHKIHIEVTAPTDGNGENKVPKVPSNSVFQDGYRDDNLILLRYSNCILNKIKQIKSKSIPDNQPVILAINNWEISDLWEYPLNPPLILSVLFGLRNGFVDQNGNEFYKQRDEIKKHSSNSMVKSNYFKDDETPIFGIILSRIQKNDTEYGDIGQSDFWYIQNPLKTDLKSIFTNFMQII